MHPLGNFHARSFENKTKLKLNQPKIFKPTNLNLDVGMRLKVIVNRVPVRTIRVPVRTIRVSSHHQICIIRNRPAVEIEFESRFCKP